MVLARHWTPGKGAVLLGYTCLALWCALEWATSASSHSILHPAALIAYFASFLGCLILSAVLFLQSPPGRRLTEERFAAALLLAPLVWNLLR